MNGFRRSGLICVYLLALGLYGCADDSNNIGAGPSPTQPIAPGPSTGVFTITGTVSESEPTQGRTIEGAQVHLTGDISTFTNAQGAFTFNNVAAGSYVLRANKGGFEEQQQSVSLPGGATTVRFNLPPTPQTVNRSISDELSQDNAVCHGSSHPCKRWDFGLHYGGEVTATLDWPSSDADLDLELRCGDTILATSSSDTLQETIAGEVEAGDTCEVRVLHKSGALQHFTLELSHPN